MSRSHVGHAAVLAAGLLVPACGRTTPGSTGQTPVPGTETKALAASLERQGASVTFAETMPASAHPYFRVPAARYVLNGENLYVFEYGSGAEAAADASRIAPDGASVGTSQVSWVSDPHFYGSGSLIVLYVGRTSPILDLLRGALGPQVAGR